MFWCCIMVLARGITPTFAQDDEAAREHYLRGNILYQQGKYKQAQDEFQKALAVISQPPPETKTADEVLTLAVKAAPAEPKKEPAPAAGRAEYIIGPEDVLYVSLWQNEDMNQEVIIRPDGRMSFPLVGDVEAVGLTVPQLDDLLTGKLKEFIKNPELSIAIRKIGGQKVIILGEVSRPGVYAVSGARTLLEAVTLAGGLTRDSVASSVVLITGGLQNPVAQRVNINKILKGEMRNNIVLHSEDIIFVPKKFIADLNYALMQIVEPLSKGAMAYSQYGILSTVGSKATSTATSE